MYGEHNVIYSLNAIYRRKWEVSILASGGEHQSISLHQHMGREHASREKKLPMVNFLIFVQKNVSTIRFQEIKIGP